MNDPFDIGDYVRITNGRKRGRRGYITGFTTSRKSAHVDIVGQGSHRVLTRLLEHSILPQVTAPDVPDIRIPVPIRAVSAPIDDADDDIAANPEFPIASLTRFLDTNDTIVPTMDNLCTLFAEHGFGQRSAVIGCFMDRLRLAEDRVVDAHNSIPIPDADFAVVNDDD